MKRWLLLYDAAPDYLARRAPLREEHLGLARAAHARGELELAGAFGEGFDVPEETKIEGAALVFRGDEGRRAAESFAQSDPYVKNGLVIRWRVMQWMVVIE
jgi:uncharacterized protein